MASPLERRHPAPKVLGILGLIFGGLVVLLTLVGMTFSSSSLEKLPVGRGALDAYLAAVEPGATILMVVMVAMSVALMAIGIGQLGYKRWARTAAIAWSLIGLLVVAGLVLHHYVSVMPAFRVFLAAFDGGSEVTRMMEGATSTSGILSVVLYAPYPIIQLVLMRKPAVVDAMSG